MISFLVKIPRSCALIILVGPALLAGCTYEGLRAQERRACVSMPQTQAERCMSRHSMTKEEYDAERAKLKRSAAREAARKAEDVDPRYEKWIP